MESEKDATAETGITQYLIEQCFVETVVIAEENVVWLEYEYVYELKDTVFFIPLVKLASPTYTVSKFPLLWAFPYLRKLREY